MPRIPRFAAVALLIPLIAACEDAGHITRLPARTTTVATGVPANPTAGAADVGDPTTPGAGNGGYDVQHYDLRFDVGDDRSRLQGRTRIEARATQDLLTFNLDLAGYTVASVEVGGRPARFTRAGDELTVTPARPIAGGATFTTTVAYSGAPQAVSDPSAPDQIGWLSAPSGTFVANEPTGAKGVFPGNDHPSDKATYTITVTAVDADTVAANGRLTGKKPAATPGHTTWTFDIKDQMATYLLQIAVGEYDVTETTGPHSIGRRDVVLRRITPEERAVLADTNAQIEFFETMFGAFPFDTYGVLVADSSPSFALETQTLTLLPAAWLLGGDPKQTSSVMAHELAHEWFGDSVSLQRWGDIWLNEGFATYAEWLWDDHNGHATLSDSVNQAMSQVGQWRQLFGTVVDPKPAFMFAPNEYGGAGVVLHALRLTVGDDAFFRILRSWAHDHAGKNGSTADFESLSSSIAGRDLKAFFDEWLHSTATPKLPS